MQVYPDFYLNFGPQDRMSSVGVRQGLGHSLETVTPPWPCQGQLFRGQLIGTGATQVRAAYPRRRWDRTQACDEPGLL